MRFILMLYANESVGTAIPPDQMERVMQTMGAYEEALTKAGAFVMTSPLQLTRDARTLRMAGGTMKRQEDSKTTYFVAEGAELQVHSGPYAETQEQLGGFYIIDVADMDEAVKWAARCPAVQWGTIEIRGMAPGF